MDSSLLFLFYIKAILLSCIIPLDAGTPVATTSSIIGDETDHFALLAFKSLIREDPHGVLNSWNHSLSFCEWEGITCGRRHPRVTVINLLSRGLVGTLSPHIGNLSFLRVLRLANNSLEGNIPSEIGRLFRLEVLSLSNNSFVGEIPANLSHCSNLVTLGVAANNLTGTIPMELGSLSKLNLLSIHFNQLTGNIPPSPGNLTNLDTISAAGNYLSGTIPDTLGSLSILTFLGLGNNQLTGEIPPSLYNMSSMMIFSLTDNLLHGNLSPDMGLKFPLLQTIQMFDNQFTGPIPVSLSNATNLQYIGLQNNSLSGKILVDFGQLQYFWGLNLGINNLGSAEADEMDFLVSLANCTSLEIFDISSNRYGGVLPNSITNLSAQLEQLLVGDNQFFGAIPSEIGNLVGLSILGMELNQFTGPIPRSIGNLKKMQRFSIHSNMLTEIPSTIGNLSLLNELYLQNNTLGGSIPTSIGNCQNLMLLNLYQNNLSGAIPKQLFSISSLTISLSLGQNRFVGTLPSEVGKLEHLMELDLSENQLSGEIPSGLSSCTSLEYLYMQGNLFQGSIPPFSSLRGLQILDLSRNSLTGQIPSYFGKFALQNLNLSFNNFEGEVPTEGIFGNASAILVQGNSRLCGGIAALGLHKCIVEKPKKKGSHLLIILVPVASLLVGLIVALSLLFFFFKKTKRKERSSRSLAKEPILKVSYEMLLNATDGFSSANLIGAGSFRSVYKGTLDEYEKPVAVKVLYLERRGASKTFTDECEALRNIRHRNLVKIVTSCSSIDFQGNDFKALVYEFLPQGSLDRWLHVVKGLNLLQRIDIAIDVATALDYLHHHCETSIVHCDLKPSNILLDIDMTAHVGDFGLSKFLPELTNPGPSSSIGIRGTIGYAAPEYGIGSEVSTHGDVYSFGVLLLEMMTGRRPTDSSFEEGLDIHSYAKMALPDQIMQIIDPLLLEGDEEAATVNNNVFPRQEIEANRIKQCLLFMVEIGVACSKELPRERMDIGEVVKELHLVKKTYLGRGH